MQDITDFLNTRKEQYLKRAENCEEVIKSLKNCIKNNESVYGEIPKYPSVIIPDEHGRKQLQSAIAKQNALIAKVELIEELQELYF